MEIKRIAQLSALYLSETEAADAEHELAKMLAFVDEVTKVSLPQEKEFAAEDGFDKVLREDTVMPSASRDSLLAGAPLAKDGFYRVPMKEEQHG